MIYLYGDSHAYFSFKQLSIPNQNYYQASITMFRIGRDGVIIHFKRNMMRSGDTIVLSYGEVDCRCHIQKQIDLGRQEDEVINDLVAKYIQTIKNNTVGLNVQIILVGVIPPTKRNEYEELHGPITHEFPFVGIDEDRIRYTNKINRLLEKEANLNHYFYFNPYSYYTRQDGTFKFELSDQNVHLGDNSYFLQKFTEFYASINIHSISHRKHVVSSVFNRILKR